MFSFTASDGMWIGRILPEVEEQLEATRIAGSTHLRTTPSLGDILGQGKDPLKKKTKKEREKERRELKNRTETGGLTNGITPPPPGQEGEIPAGYPLGKRLRAAEYEASKQHAPRDSATGKPLCWNSNSNAGCTVNGGECPFGLHRKMKRNDLHWTIRAQLARRGGIKGTTLLNAAAIDGFIQSLRDSAQQEAAAKRERPPANTNTGGYSNEGDNQLVEARTVEETYPTAHMCDIVPPPGLSLDLDTGTLKHGGSAYIMDPMDTDTTNIPTGEPNMYAGIIPGDISKFDFTLLEENLRDILFGKDEWLTESPIETRNLKVELDSIEDQLDLKNLFTPYAPMVDRALHCPLLNWLGRNMAMHDGGFEPALAQELTNIMSSGNSHLRKLASESLANLRCLDRFHAGEGGICRIWWGSSIALDDCTCQPVTIGPLHFNVVDFGDCIILNEFMQRKLASPDKDERNQCTLIAVAAGLLAVMTPTQILPDRSRVIKTALELRIAE